MWMTFVSGLQAVASASADDAAKAATEGDSTLPPDTIPNFEGKLPTTQELLEMLESMTDISDEEKTTLREDLLKNIRGIGEAADNGWTMEAMILLSLLSVVALIFVFFVYKLFKCLSEREMKKQKKKNLKEKRK